LYRILYVLVVVVCMHKQLNDAELSRLRLVDNNDKNNKSILGGR
jgi:hypothetical protein